MAKWPVFYFSQFHSGTNSKGYPFQSAQAPQYHLAVLSPNIEGILCWDAYVMLEEETTVILTPVQT